VNLSVIGYISFVLVVFNTVRENVVNKFSILVKQRSYRQFRTEVLFFNFFK